MSRFLRILVRELLLVVLFIGVMMAALGGDSVYVSAGPFMDPSDEPIPTISISVGPSTEPAASTLPSKRTTPLQKCAQGVVAFTPVRLTIDQVGLDIALTAQPLGVGNTLPVPISSHRSVNATTGAWWKDGAQPGSGKGVVEIGTHTFSAGYDAAGNKVLRVTPGAIAKLYDAAGNVGACYIFDRRVNVLPADPLPPDIWRVDGPPGLAIAACDDFDPKSKSYGVRAYHIWTRVM